MEIGIKRLHKTDGTSSLKGYADVVLAKVIIVKGCRIVDGSNGLFVSLPQSKGKDDKYYPIVMIDDTELYKKIQNVVLAEYRGEQLPQEENQAPAEEVNLEDEV